MLHVLRYRREELDRLVGGINALGYGLTLGVHSRVDGKIERVVRRAHAGNIYVNRNIVGAVVGVQPFGGEGLSGTGPKAGGPLSCIAAFEVPCRCCARGARCSFRKRAKNRCSCRVARNRMLWRRLRDWAIRYEPGLLRFAIACVAVSCRSVSAVAGPDR